MRIAIFSDNFYPELSGISDSLALLAKGLGSKGHEVRFYVPYYSHKNYERVGRGHGEVDLGQNVSVYRLLSLPYGAGTGQGRLVIPTAAAYRDLKKWRADILYSNLIFGAGIEALIAHKFLKLPFIGTNHTPMGEFLHYGPVSTEWMKNKMLRFVSWYYNKCDFVTAPSNFLFKEMAEYGFSKPHRAISNPIDINKFTTVSAEKKAKLKKALGVNGPVVLYSGRLAPEKHVDVVIKAFAKAKQSVRNAHLVITGTGLIENDLKKLVKDLQLSGSVRFMGFVGLERLIDIYGASDMFVVASTAETQCLSMMNAMACALPSIAVNCGGLPEYLNSQCGFIVEPNDTEAMAKHVVYLCTNPESAAHLGQKARQHVEQFSIANVVDEWIELFQSYVK